MNHPRPLPQGKQRGAERFAAKDYHHHAGLAHSYLETAKAHLVRAKGLKGADAAKYHALAKEHLAKAQEHIGHAERHASFKALSEEIAQFSVQAGASFNPAVKEEARFSAAPEGVDPNHHAVLEKHGYAYKGASGDAHYYEHMQDKGRTAQYSMSSKTTSTFHTAGHGTPVKTTIQGANHEQLAQKLGYGHDVSDEVERWKRG